MYTDKGRNGVRTLYPRETPSGIQPAASRLTEHRARSWRVFAAVWIAGMLTVWFMLGWL